jgi:endonuclease/exonuclease/phosphatase family metal-dependent hydrolase
VGWCELKEAPVEEAAIENTARVIREVHPDVLCVVEAEDRSSLNKFSEKMMPIVKGKPFEHVMLVEGCDDRGINVGIMVQEPCKIEKIVSHVDDAAETGPIFSRDCAEYTLTTPSGETLLIMENHFKSKSGTGTEKKRLRQAKRVREIYDQRLKEGCEYIAVMGDLNSGAAKPRTRSTDWRWLGRCNGPPQVCWRWSTRNFRTRQKEGQVRLHLDVSQAGRQSRLGRR